MEHNTNLQVIDVRKMVSVGVLDLIWLAVIYYLPTLSHWSSIPFYLFEPMRVVIFVTILTTGNKTNSFILAATLPIFSFFVGGHPVLIKSILMIFELTMNVWIYWKIIERNKKAPLAAFSSIVLSKVAYYIIKYIIVSVGLLNMSMIGTPIWIQLVVAVILSSLFFLMKTENK